jgi:ATP-binding cassette, subfamily B, bacterial
LRAKLHAFRLLVRVPFRISWWRPLAAAGMQVVSQLAVVSFAWGMSEAIDAVTEKRSGAATTAVVVLAVSSLWAVGGPYVAFVLRNQMVERTTLALDTELGAAATSIAGIEHFERVEYLDKLEILRQQHQNLARLPDWAAVLLGTVVRLAVTLAVLATIDWRLLLLPVFSVPAVLGTFRMQKIFYQAWDELMPHGRLQGALFRLGADEPGGRELRVLGRRSHVAARHAQEIDISNAIISRARKRGLLGQTAGWAVFGAAFTGALLLIGHDALAHHVAVGQVVLAITLAAQLNGQITTSTSVLNDMSQGLETAERYDWLLAESRLSQDRRPQAHPVPARLDTGIRFEGVGFSYPGTDRAVLEGVDLFIPAGSTVALVGPNGAGKTTLVKLLTRMYEPTAGRITVDGTDLGELDPWEWREGLSAGFQDHAHFEFSARESVGCGALPLMGSDPDLLRAFSQATADDVLALLPDGLSSQLGRQFERGVELSGGQWQKLALARAMMRPSPLLFVLDEPTASLDAAAEAALFEGYGVASRAAAHARGTITVFVTHRLSTVRMADTIVLVDQGRILEVGSHRELIQAAGTYAQLFELQARAYA